MSQTPTAKFKTKKLRRRNTAGATVEKRSRGEILFDSAVAAGLRVDENLKQEKMFRLLKRVVDGRVRVEVANHLARLPEDQLLYGPTENVFRATAALKSLFTIGSASTCDFTLGKATVLALKNGMRVSLITDKHKILRYTPGKWSYVELLSVTQLPADLRKWPEPWASQYLKTNLDELRATAAYQGNIQKKPGAGVLAGALSSIHSYRQINMSPHKKQKVRTQRKQTFDMDDAINPDDLVGLHNF